MSSVLVVIVLLGMWAFVLVPLVRQRNIRADEIRSVARFSSALRVLSRGHSFSERSAPGLGRWVMPPREGLAAVRARRLAAASSRPAARTAGSGPAAARRRRLMTWLACAVTATLLLALVGGRLFVVLQVLADVAFVTGILACRWSVAQEQAVAARLRRRRDTRELRTSLEESRGQAWVSAEAPLMTVPLHAPVHTMTVPLDAPAQLRRAAPTVSSGVRRPAAAQHPGLQQAAVASVPPPVAATPDRAAPGRVAPGRVAPSRPRAEPVVLAEIDLDWEPAVPEPSSLVRLVDLSGSRRARLFEDSPADGVDVGDDAELDALVQRRLAASGW